MRRSWLAYWLSQSLFLLNAPPFGGPHSFQFVIAHDGGGGLVRSREVAHRRQVEADRVLQPPHLRASSKSLVSHTGCAKRSMTTAYS